MARSLVTARPAGTARPRIEEVAVAASVSTVDNAIFAKAIEALQQGFGEDGLQLLIASSGYDTKREMPFRPAADLWRNRR